MTRFANLSRTQALGILAVAIVFLAWGLLACLPRPTPPSSVGTKGGEDLKLYRRIIERVHSGENYYDAAGDELRQRGYPTRSVFNWRLPTYAWLLGALPDLFWAQFLLGILTLMTLLLAFSIEQQESHVARAGLLTVLLIGPFLWCIDGDAFLSQELWAGVLIALSVCAYARGWWPLGLAAGLGALFFRELALPYAVLAAILAGWQGRRREVSLWIIGFVLYLLLATYHSTEVHQRITPLDRAEAEGWIQFGGPTFILSTVQMNAFLFSLPRGIAAVYLILSLLGLAGWRGEIGLRIGLTVAAYTAAFAVVGKPFNNYWGLLDAPLLVFGLVRAPAALRDLFTSLHLTRMTCEKNAAINS